MFVGSATGPPPKQRRSPRFPFDSLLRVTLFPLAEGTGLWGRSIDLCREGIGVAVAAELTPDELVAMQIPLAVDKPVTVKASVRYCNQGRCGFQFVIWTISSAKRFKPRATSSARGPGILEV